jgi:Zn-dependent M28 family amino/carboxypeptidase
MTTPRESLRPWRQRGCCPAVLRRKLGKDIIFAAFGAEEKGTLGSAKMADTLDQLGLLPSFMINLDMVGRLRDSVLQVSGPALLKKADSLLFARQGENAPWC